MPYALSLLLAIVLLTLGSASQTIAENNATPIAIETSAPLDETHEQTIEAPAVVETVIETVTIEATLEPQQTATETASPTLVASSTAETSPVPTQTSVPTETPTTGMVIVHAIDENGDVALDGCAVVFENNAGQRGTIRRQRCDSQSGNDGTTSLPGITAGSYLLAWGSSNLDYVGGSDIPFEMSSTGNFEITVQFIRAGTLLIHKTKPDGSPLLDSCFFTYAPPDPPYPVIGVCDGQDGESDGTITLRLPPGQRWTRETTVPVGFARAIDVPVEIVAGETTEVTIVAPLASSLLIRATDQWGARITPTCLSLFTDAGNGSPGAHVFTGCVDTSTAEVTIAPLQPGDYLIRLNKTKPGYLAPQYVPISIKLSQNRSFKYRLSQPPPTLSVPPQVQNVLQTSAEISWQTDQLTLGTLTYGETSALETGSRSADAESRVHRIRLGGLLPGRTYYVRITSTNPNGSVISSLIKFRTASASATARLVVTMTNSDGSTPIGNACVRLVNSSRATVWTECDYLDSAPNDGRLISGMIAPGKYTIEELVSPARYTIAKPVSIDLAANKTTRVTIKHTRGGASLLVETREFIAHDRTPILLGACYQVFENLKESPGALLSQNCDANDRTDGLTRLGSLKAGVYLILMTTAPKGYYSYDQDFQRVEINPGQTSVTVKKFAQPLDRPGDVQIRSVDANGNVIKGACFALTGTGAGVPEVISTVRCDESDGALDGKTNFYGRQTNTRYALVQTTAPRGYQLGPRASLLTLDDAVTVVPVVHSRGGHTVRITHRDKISRALVPGSCYALVRGTSTVIAGNCDWNRDGVVEVIGVPDGNYTLVQTSSSPPGHWVPNRSVRVDSANVSVFVESTPSP